MRVRILAALIGYGILSACAGWAQVSQGQSQPEISSQEAPVTFSSRVNLVSAPVVVRDREGRAVGNLRQENFRLFDKGKLQTITKFTVEKTGQSPSAHPPRNRLPGTFWRGYSTTCTSPSAIWCRRAPQRFGC